jgi:hypothetical protein
LDASSLYALLHDPNAQRAAHAHQTSMNSNPARRDVDACQGAFRDAIQTCGERSLFGGGRMKNRRSRLCKANAN